jgi:hypothetical protein
MAGYRKREVLPEDTTVQARITSASIVRGKFGRQVEVDAVVTEGEHRGTQLHDWFSFATDKATGEEYISYGGRLFDLLVLAEPDLDDKLIDADDDREIDKIVADTVKRLEGIEFLSRLSVKKPDEPDKRRNAFDAASMGPASEATPAAPF